MEEISYIPILKAKRAEYSAITQLDPLAKSKIIPLFEIEPTPLDPDTEVPDKTYNELLVDFGKKISRACAGINGIYLDGILIEEQFINASDTYPIINAINQARTEGMHVIPVSSPTRSPSYLSAINLLIQGEICLRLTVTDLANPQLIDAYISRLGIPKNSIDILIDLRDLLTDDSLLSGRSQMLALGLINNLNNLHAYRKIILAAGSFPVDLSQIAVGTYSQSRLEWILWQSLYTSGELSRFVIYSDYGIQHPDYTRLATRFPSVTASVRYTGDNDFWVFRGKKANQYGYDQYGAHSQNIVAHNEYSGKKFCQGDKEIDDYANVYAQYLLNPSTDYKFGSPEVWRKIGQNHHITKVIDQLANLYGL